MKTLIKRLGNLSLSFATSILVSLAPYAKHLPGFATRFLTKLSIALMQRKLRRNHEAMMADFESRN